MMLTGEESRPSGGPPPSRSWHADTLYSESCCWVERAGRQPVRAAPIGPMVGEDTVSGLIVFTHHGLQGYLGSGA